MSKAQRNKGARGEREVAAMIHDHLGYTVTRRCRQHDGDSDLLGIPGWSIEVKNHDHLTRSILQAWWEQTCIQAGDTLLPALWYKRGRGWWRVVWSDHPSWGYGLEYALEGEPEAWARAVRESIPTP